MFTGMIGALRTPDDARWYRWSIAAAIGGAWLALVVWGASPYAGWLDHAALGGADAALALRLPVFVLGWTLMSVAMMLPASLPLVNLFRRLVLSRADRAGLLARLLAGYLAVWAAFGLVAYLADAALHAALARAGVGEAAGPWIAAAVALAAGVYQFTPLKEACLEQCHSPYSFLVARWRGRQPGRDALLLGVRHGLFCLGCCWTLMLLMFALGAASPAWMLALGTVMAAERATSWGRRLTRPLGFALGAWAVLLVLRATVA
jgi:predicted metal-binding membrane protein